MIIASAPIDSEEDNKKEEELLDEEGFQIKVKKCKH
jgi:hypothetical protein